MNSKPLSRPVVSLLCLVLLLVYTDRSWSRSGLEGLGESTYQVNSDTKSTRVEAQFGYVSSQAQGTNSLGENTLTSIRGLAFDMSGSRMITERFGLSSRARLARLSSVSQRLALDSDQSDIVQGPADSNESDFSGLLTASLSAQYGIPFEFSTLVLEATGQILAAGRDSASLATVQGRDHLALSAQFQSYIGKIAVYQSAGLQVDTPRGSEQATVSRFAVGGEIPFFAKVRLGLAHEVRMNDFSGTIDGQSSQLLVRYDFDNQTQVVGRVLASGERYAEKVADSFETGVNLVRKIQ